MTIRLAAAILILSLVSSAAQALTAAEQTASTAEQHAQAFTAVYSALCVKQMRNLVALQDKLKALPPPSVAYVSQNPLVKDAKAWVIPSRHGSFVLTLSNQGSSCTVHAPDMDSTQAQKYFSALVKDAPKPIQVTSPAKTPGHLPHMGPTQTVSSLWLKRRDPRVLALSLTTTQAIDAPVQAMLTVSWVQAGL